MRIQNLKKQACSKLGILNDFEEKQDKEEEKEEEEKQNKDKEKQDKEEEEKIAKYL